MRCEYIVSRRITSPGAPIQRDDDSAAIKNLVKTTRIVAEAANVQLKHLGRCKSDSEYS